MYVTAVDTENETSRINTAQAHISTPDGHLIPGLVAGAR